jgi:hypothetical protein
MFRPQNKPPPAKRNIAEKNQQLAISGTLELSYCKHPRIKNERIVPNMGAGHCLEPEGNGVSLGEGVEEGPSPPGRKKDKQSVLGEGGGSMEKEEEGIASRA